MAIAGDNWDANDAIELQIKKKLRKNKIHNWNICNSVFGADH